MLQTQAKQELEGMTGSQVAGVLKGGLAVAAVGLGVLGLWIYLRGGRKANGLQDLSVAGARRERQRPKPWSLTLHYIDRATGATIDFRTVTVQTFHEASNRLRHYVDSRDLGGSQLGRACGDIHDAAGKFVGHVSYNGRVWSTRARNWKQSHRPLYNPAAWGREGLSGIGRNIISHTGRVWPVGGWKGRVLGLSKDERDAVRSGSATVIVYELWPPYGTGAKRWVPRRVILNNKQFYARAVR